MYLVPQILEWINEIISKVCYEETQKCVVSDNSYLKNFVNFQEKHPCEIGFLNKVAGYMGLTANVLQWNLSHSIWYSVACAPRDQVYNRCSRIKYLTKAYCHILNFYFSSFIQNISVFTKDFKNHKTYFKPLISGKIIF